MGTKTEILRAAWRAVAVPGISAGELPPDLRRILSAMLPPPVGGLFQVGLGVRFWRDILLTLPGYIPGIVPAVWIIARR